MATETFRFYFDPICPWTWMTSRWLLDAAEQTGATVEWHNLSLAVVNVDKEIPEQYRAAVEGSIRAHRVIAALLADGEPGLVGDFYTEWGRHVHHDGEFPSAELVGQVASAVGAERWASAADDESWDAAVERSTNEGQELAGGGEVGSPVLAFGSPRVGVFGPIVSPPPQGAEAVALLDQVVAAASNPAFFELKRGRNEGPRMGPRP